MSSKNKLILLGCLLISCIFLQAQNLVPNLGFETHATCPTGGGQITYSTGWYSPTTGTPDYFNACGIAGFDIPNNIFGTEPAYNGNAYAGLLSWQMNPINPREYIQTQLASTLTAGKKYYVSFYVSLADSVVIACNSIGAYLSATAISSSSPYLLPYTPQIANNSSNPLTSKTGWTLVADTFTATGGEQFITIGNFNDNANSDTIFVGGASFENYSYYYIDDVSVELYDNVMGQVVNGNDSKAMLEVYPNPGPGLFSIKWLKANSYANSIEVYNMFGENVYSSSTDPPKTEIDLRDQTNGIYFLHIQNNGVVVTQKLVIQK